MKFKGLKFFWSVVVIFILLSIFDYKNIPKVIDSFSTTLSKVILIFIAIIVLTALINYFLKPKQIMKYFGEKSAKKGLFFTLFAGVLSHGPMYAWYPMLSSMRKQGLKYGLIATFMYARAVKIPLLPFMVDMFGVVFTIVVNIYILIFAVIQGIIVDKLTKTPSSN